jgi:hypothetical protein
VSPSEGRRAPDRIQHIVKAVLDRNSMRGIQLASPNEHNRAVEMADGRPATAAVREFLLDYWTDVETAQSDSDCRHFSDDIYQMRPRINARQRMYVKFILDIDTDSDSASHIRILRFHPAIGSDPIDRIPEARQ